MSEQYVQAVKVIEEKCIDPGHLSVDACFRLGSLLVAWEQLKDSAHLPEPEIFYEPEESDGVMTADNVIVTVRWIDQGVSCEISNQFFRLFWHSHVENQLITPTVIVIEEPISDPGKVDNAIQLTLCAIRTSFEVSL